MGLELKATQRSPFPCHPFSLWVYPPKIKQDPRGPRSVLLLKWVI